jgi:uncharacterized protein
MKKLFFTTFICFLFLLTGAQIVEGPLNNKRFIEVSGTSETEITPDEIYITITLQERSENREKKEIEKQEEDLKKNLKELGIDLANLTLNSADADYGRLRTLKKDVIISKSYILKINSAEKLGKVYERLDKINAHDAYVSRVDHSKIIELTKENKVKAMKAGKEKAEYLLAAIGQQAGLPLQISETESYIENPVQRGGRMLMKNVYQSDRMLEESEPEISFRKIKIRSTYHMKFEITGK